ncbi:hypothetical protein AKJ57_02280 [candidate division MSBL1 archaeon SCGC-AAA259A05]|uniref:Uncharacterized protein n=1 Tax=candidate division MSBL1 archaeon SCGC-AAA259A05 TaxID=1698259 RepID=A0A133UAE4_9EURY|nr:hypothetical protein AKJ57_02280 [candidate division MSBL1 archaeon SCGC-AAA259A05]
MEVIILEKLEEYSEKAKEETKTLLRKLLTADDVVRMRYLKGDLSREKASKFYGCIAVVIDEIALEALKSRDIAETIAPVLLDKIENGRVNPLPYTHILQMLAYRHQLEIDGEVQDEAEVIEAFDQIKGRMDLDNIEQRKAELEKELKGKIQQLKEKWEKNLMFG